MYLFTRGTHSYIREKLIQENLFQISYNEIMRTPLVTSCSAVIPSRRIESRSALPKQTIRFIDLFCGIGGFHTAAARLGWDCGQRAGAAVIAGDTVKLVFHSGVFALALAPIPISKVLRAAAAGEGWAIAMSAAMASGPVNRYVVHVF